MRAHMYIRTYDLQFILWCKGANEERVGNVNIRGERNEFSETFEMIRILFGHLKNEFFPRWSAMTQRALAHASCDTNYPYHSSNFKPLLRNNSFFLGSNMQVCYVHIDDEFPDFSKKFSSTKVYTVFCSCVNLSIFLFIFPVFWNGF